MRRLSLAGIDRRIRDLEKNLRRPLTDDEWCCFQWAIQNYGGKWRERYTESLEEFMAQRPKWARPKRWYWWYRHPFGDHQLNKIHGVMRRLVREETEQQRRQT